MNKYFFSQFIKQECVYEWLRSKQWFKIWEQYMEDAELRLVVE